MILYPPVIVHGLAQARVALALGKPLTLLSAPGAAGFAGWVWWRELVMAARAAEPRTPVIDILDCADASGMALAAIRGGVCRLVLWVEAPGHRAVSTIANAQGGFVLPIAPKALDMADADGFRRLSAWLDAPPSETGDSGGGVM